MWSIALDSVRILFFHARMETAFTIVGVEPRIAVMRDARPVRPSSRTDRG